VLSPHGFGFQMLFLLGRKRITFMGEHTKIRNNIPTNAAITRTLLGLPGVSIRVCFVSYQLIIVLFIILTWGLRRDMSLTAFH
jgi:hypothetical protein